MFCFKFDFSYFFEIDSDDDDVYIFNDDDFNAFSTQYIKKVFVMKGEAIPPRYNHNWDWTRWLYDDRYYDYHYKWKH